MYTKVSNAECVYLISNPICIDLERKNLRWKFKTMPPYNNINNNNNSKLRIFFHSFVHSFGRSVVRLLFVLGVWWLVSFVCFIWLPFWWRRWCWWCCCCHFSLLHSYNSLLFHCVCLMESKMFNWRKSNEFHFGDDLLYNSVSQCDRYLHYYWKESRKQINKQTIKLHWQPISSNKVEINSP